MLLLGRFTGGGKHVLRILAAQLRKLGYAPIIFDFAPSASRDQIETVIGLAWLSCFVIADLTNPKSVRLETYAIVPQLAVPFATIVRANQSPASLMAPLRRKFEWVLPTHSYRDDKELVRRLEAGIVRPALALRAKLLARRRAEAVVPLSRRDRHRP